MSRFVPVFSFLIGPSCGFFTATGNYERSVQEKRQAAQASESEPDDQEVNRNIRRSKRSRRRSSRRSQSDTQVSRLTSLKPSSLPPPPLPNHLSSIPPTTSKKNPKMSSPIVQSPPIALSAKPVSPLMPKKLPVPVQKKG